MKKLISFLLSLCLLVGALPAYAAGGAPPSWAAEAYQTLESREILRSSYSPYQVSGNISRGDFVTLLVKLLDKTAPSQELNRYPAMEPGYFTDAPYNQDYLRAAAYGILEGSSTGGQRYANGNDSLTREQAAKMVCVMLDFFSNQLGHAVTPSAAPAAYTDAAAISSWALPFTQSIASYQLMVGDQGGNFNPQVYLDWPSAVVLLERALGLLDGAMTQEVSGLPLQSGVDWSGAARFGAGDYSVSRPKTGWASGYYTIDNGDGTVSALTVGSQETFTVERFDKTGALVSTKSLPIELPTFGAFFDSGTHFYMVFGRSNPDQNDSQEVFRVVQYDREWNRLGAVSVNGKDSYTVEPFRSTVSRMAVSGDGSTVALYTARTRYDGHQSNITILMNTDPFRIQTVMGQQFPTNHVSHSFGQFIQFDGSQMVTVDHGDAYPRSFVLQAGGRELDLLKIAGEIGQNVTNAIGSGLEVSDSGYLFLGCSDPQNGSEGQPWNVFLAYTGKSGGSAALTWLTRSDKTINCARLVKVDGNTFVAMWQQDADIHYLVLDAAGKAVGGEQVFPSALMPPTQPVVIQGDICWIQTSSLPHLVGKPVLYRLSIQ